jgi:hypothetical protein
VKVDGLWSNAMDRGRVDAVVRAFQGRTLVKMERPTVSQ